MFLFLKPEPAREGSLGSEESCRGAGARSNRREADPANTRWGCTNCKERCTSRDGTRESCKSGVEFAGPN